jgi:hypothetical protein
MARDLYGLEDALLLELRRKAQMELAKGMSLTSFGADGGQSAQQIILHARSRIREINAELRARNHPEAPPEDTTPMDFSRVSFAGGS